MFVHVFLTGSMGGVWGSILYNTWGTYLATTKGKGVQLGGLSVGDIRNERVVSSHNGPAIRTRIILRYNTRNVNTTPDNTSANRFRTLRLESNGITHFNNGNIHGTIRGIGATVGSTLYNGGTTSVCTTSSTVVTTSNARSGSDLNTGTVLTTSVTITETTTGTCSVPLCEFLNNTGTGHLPIPVVGVLGNKTRTTGAISIRRFVVVPTNTRDFENKLHEYARIFRSLTSVLNTGKLTASINSRNNFTPSLSSSSRTVRCVLRTVRGTKCRPKHSFILTVSTTSDR